MSLYAAYENAPVASTVSDTDQLYVIQSGALKTVTPAVLQQTVGGTVAVTAGATTLTVTQALHNNRTINLNNTAPLAVTLPQATGSGAIYRFLVLQAATATASTIKVANATDVMQGISLVLTTAAANVVGYATSATSDTISLNGTTLGGVAGDIIELIDAKTGFFSVKIVAQASGTTPTPFSATV